MSPLLFRFGLKMCYKKGYVEIPLPLPIKKKELKNKKNLKKKNGRKKNMLAYASQSS